MKKFAKLMIIAGSVTALAACTPHRTDSDPVPDGDTVEVVINGPKSSQSNQL